jgi:hypothetical protein
VIVNNRYDEEIITNGFSALYSRRINSFVVSFLSGSSDANSISDMLTGADGSMTKIPGRWPLSLAKEEKP